MNQSKVIARCKKALLLVALTCALYCNVARGDAVLIINDLAVSGPGSSSGPVTGAQGGTELDAISGLDWASGDLAHVYLSSDGLYVSITAADPSSTITADYPRIQNDLNDGSFGLPFGALYWERNSTIVPGSATTLTISFWNDIALSSAATVTNFHMLLLDVDATGGEGTDRVTLSTDSSDFALRTIAHYTGVPGDTVISCSSDTVCEGTAASGATEPLGNLAVVSPPPTHEVVLTFDDALDDAGLQLIGFGSFAWGDFVNNMTVVLLDLGTPMLRTDYQVEITCECDPLETFGPSYVIDCYLNITNTDPVEVKVEFIEAYISGTADIAFGDAEAVGPLAPYYDDTVLAGFDGVTINQLTSEFTLGAGATVQYKVQATLGGMGVFDFNATTLIRTQDLLGTQNSTACSTDICSGGCAAGDECEILLGCLGGIGCVTDPRPDGTHCGEDGDECTAAQTCVSGVCTGGGPIDCDDGNPCTLNTCNATIGCEMELLTNVTCTPEIYDDICFIDYICNAGVCERDSSGSIKSCDDGIACTIDTCDSVNDCQNEPDDGYCVVNNPSLDPCLVPYCNVTTGCGFRPGPVAPCDDGDACTLLDLCFDGTCVGGDAVVCDNVPEEPCVQHQCNATTGTCDLTYPTGNFCFPPFDCIVGGTCDGQGNCTGTPDDGRCDDNDPCTSNTCDEDVGCVSTVLPNGHACDLHDACVLQSTCSMGMCTVTERKTCDDGDEDTFDICVNNACVNIPSEHLPPVVGPNGPYVTDEQLQEYIQQYFQNYSFDYQYDSDDDDDDDDGGIVPESALFGMSLGALIAAAVALLILFVGSFAWAVRARTLAALSGAPTPSGPVQYELANVTKEGGALVWR